MRHHLFAFSSRTFHSAYALGTATLSCLLLTATAQAQTYTLTDLGTLGGSQSFATDVNNSGQVVGNSVTSDGSTHGFISGVDGGPIKDLGTEFTSFNIYTGESYTTVGTDSYAYGINNKGQIAGNIDSHAVVSTANGGKFNAIPGVFGSNAVDINDKGQVTGILGVGSFIYDTKNVNNPYVGVDELDNFYAVAINNKGQVLGEAEEREASLYNPASDTYQSVVPLGGAHYSFFDVNDSGQVVGASPSDAFTGGSHAYLTGPNGQGPTTDLGSLAPRPRDGGAPSEAHGVNNKDQVVGMSGIASDPNGSHAFIWANGVMTDLNSLIAPGGGLTLTDATAISDTGFIVGDATNAAGQTHAFLLTPVAVPEASTVVSFGLLLGLGIGAVVVRRRKAAQVKLV